MSLVAAGGALTGLYILYKTIEPITTVVQIIGYFIPSRQRQQDQRQEYIILSKQDLKDLIHEMREYDGVD